MLLASSRNALRGTGCVWGTGSRTGPAEGKNKTSEGQGELGTFSAEFEFMGRFGAG